MSAKWPCTQDIMAELDIPSYLVGVKGAEGIEEAARKALTAMETSHRDYRLHVETVHEFMKALWTKYDCLEIYEILDKLTKIEPALLDIERDPEAGKRYRDHFVHLFHVFVFGLRIFSAMIEKLDDVQTSEVLKVKSESLNTRIRGRNEAGDQVEFRDYPWKERLFYLWTLMATLHDIAIPITHLNRIRDALNEFSGQFHLEISGPQLVPSLPADLDAYLGLLSRIWRGKLTPGLEDWRYNKPPSGDVYVKGYFERLFARKEHGVLGGFLVYKKVEEIFLQGKSKYRLDMACFHEYKELVQEEDIARAALAISLHDVAHSAKFGLPQFMPLEFREFPLTTILILADSLQEYLRWEGTSIRGGTKLVAFPRVKLRVNKRGVLIECHFCVTEDKTEQQYFCAEVKNMMAAAKRPSSGGQIAHAANDLSVLVGDELKSKVLLGNSLTVSLGFHVDGKELCGHVFRS